MTIFENNGFQGARSEVLQLLSAGARAHSAFWNANMVTRLSGLVLAGMLALDLARPDPRGGIGEC